MTPDELRSAIAFGREQRSIEFKGPGERTDGAFLAKVIKAILGMANKQDGGTVVIGVTDDGTSLTPSGLTRAQRATWTYDDLQSNVSGYADPYVELQVMTINLDEKDYVAVEVQAFSDYPVICKREYSKILRKGALYVRPRGRIETVEVPSHVEMREVIERAAEAVARRMIATANRLQTARPADAPSDVQRFLAESSDLI